MGAGLTIPARFEGAFSRKQLPKSQNPCTEFTQNINKSFIVNPLCYTILHNFTGFCPICCHVSLLKD